MDLIIQESKEIGFIYCKKACNYIVRMKGCKMSNHLDFALCFLLWMTTTNLLVMVREFVFTQFLYKMYSYSKETGYTDIQNVLICRVHFEGNVCIAPCLQYTTVGNEVVTLSFNAKMDLAYFGV